MILPLFNFFWLTTFSNFAYHEYMGEKGQALLIVVLVMTVALTVGLAAVTRSIVNIRIATQEEQSQRAFSAAEAGIEETLRGCTGTSCPTPAPPVGGFSNRTTYKVDVVDVSGGAILVNGGNLVPQDEGTQVLLVPFDRLQERPFNNSDLYQGRIAVFWGNPAISDDCENPALEIMSITGTPGEPKLERFALDGCSARRANNQFSAPLTGTTIKGKAFKYKYELPQEKPNYTDGLLLRLIPIYHSGSLAVATNKPGKPLGDCGPSDDQSRCLPLQGAEITSTGKTTDQGTPEIQRKIRVFNSFPGLPTALFNYVIFSGGADLEAQTR